MNFGIFFAFFLEKSYIPIIFRALNHPNLKKLFLISILYSYTCNAQYALLGAGAYGRANSLVAVPELSSIYQNPAGIAFLNYNALALAYHKILPVDGFGTVGMWGNFKTKYLNIGVYADNFGDRYYHESRLGIVTAKKMDMVSMGIKFSLLSNGIYEMRTTQTILGEFGIIASPNKFLNLGLHLINFTRAKVNENQVLPTVLVFGAGLSPSKRVNISGQVDYPLNEKPRFRMGLFYQIKDQLSISTGVNPYIKSVHFGLGFDIKKYKFQYAVSTHPSVGLSNQLTLAILFNEKK